ncbi:MAG: mevalonate kinase [Ignisphaera sp.]
MDEVTVKVPTKITLFGEHAVIYGVPAIASTIPVYMNIKGKIFSEEVISITFSNKLSTSLNNITIRRDREEIQLRSDIVIIKKLLNYILTSIDLCEKELGTTRNRGYSLIIDSPLPTGIGLGTSAATSVGTIVVCLALNGYIENIEDYRQDIAKMAWNVEKTVQGVASPMDTYTITLGGLRYIEPNTPKAELIDIDDQIPVIVGYTNRKNTTAELVRKVRKLKEKDEIIFNELLNIIKTIVENARKAFLNHDIETLGVLMNINHGVLQSLGIVDMTHDTLLHMLRNAGAIGAKTSGAGSGGAFLALARSASELDKLAVVAEALGAKVISKGLCKDGVLLV